MWGVALGFVAGAVLAPGLIKLVKPVLRETLKTGIVVGTQVQQLVAEVQEDLEDLAAEAKAEVDAKAATRKTGNYSKKTGTN